MVQTFSYQSVTLQPMQEFYFAIIHEFLNLQKNYINQWPMTKELLVTEMGRSEIKFSVRWIQTLSSKESLKLN